MFIDIHTLSISLGRKRRRFEKYRQSGHWLSPPGFLQPPQQTGRPVGERPRERSKRCRACPLRKNGGFKAFLEAPPQSGYEPPAGEWDSRPHGVILSRRSVTLCFSGGRQKSQQTCQSRRKGFQTAEQCPSWHEWQRTNSESQTKSAQSQIKSFSSSKTPDSLYPSASQGGGSIIPARGAAGDANRSGGKAGRKPGSIRQTGSAGVLCATADRETLSARR